MKIDTSKKYIVGLSGGPDSIYMLNELSKIIDNQNIIACHVNYNYRSDSNIDQQICEKFCKAKGIKLLIKNIEQSYDKLKENFESWAREQRYDMFYKVGKENGIDTILIAHNLNDDIETFLMQKQKNIKPKYYGINKNSSYKDLKIIRPIIEVKKSEILNSLKEQNITYAVDTTNSDTKYTRNKIRSELKEDDFFDLQGEKEKLNSDLETLNNLIKELGPTRIEIKLLKENSEFGERLIFQKIEECGLGHLFYKRKKSTLKEIYKQLVSNKSKIIIQIEDLEICKNNKYAYIYNKAVFKFFDMKIEEFDKDKYPFILNLNDFDKIDHSKDLRISNNFETLQNQLTYKGYPLIEVFNRNKIPEIERKFVIIIYNYYNKNVINNII
ncbi:tRNA(Ile)-lysidine synthase [Spiroplasma chinense]|uniref:tRNA(Ile)-lysidine synthase n=1 Tax=Spiroplasma chinense TaxID=216932 RepID=A0A5B9Y2H6_9MOLU|nr:tRNA lysidine(34) synthetase TilS [Spiroplasma chinense]QEH61210.1 tRNA(Ile)-lysidine synthase [Spiroplasma chinense]